MLFSTFSACYKALQQTAVQETSQQFPENMNDKHDTVASQHSKREAYMCVIGFAKRGLPQTSNSVNLEKTITQYSSNILH